MEELLNIGKLVLEILLMWLIIYYILLFIRGTRAVQVLKGVVILLILFFLTQLLRLETINQVLKWLFGFGAIAFLIIFQPELRRGLAHLGQNPLFALRLKRERLIDEIVKSCLFLSRRKIGGLIAIEREMRLAAYTEDSIMLDSEVSTELINTIFLPSSPLHDGAIVIQEERIAACSCLLPLSRNPGLSKTLGTRHRAALGLAEETDAVVVVISEETGAISIAISGKLTRDMDEAGLRKVLRNVYGSFEEKGAKEKKKLKV